VTGYIISNVVAIPLVPFFIQRLGRKTYFAICIGGFTIASFLCGTATTLPSLVLYRVIQGAFGGGLVSTSNIILRDTFPPNRLAASQGFFGVALTLGPALGPSLGGVITDQFSWPWIFDINLIPGAIAIAIVVLYLRDPLPPQRIPFDVIGFAMLALGLGSYQYILDEGERNYWLQDPVIATAAILAVVGITAFVAWEQFGAKHPIMNFRIFRYRNIRLGAPVAIAMGMLIFGPTVVLAQYVQIVLGFTATLAGLFILLRALPVVILTPIVSMLLHKIDSRVMLSLGIVLSASSLSLLFLRMTTGSDFAALAGVMILSGIGQAMLLVPLLYAVFGSLPPQESARASAILSLSVQLGGSTASALLIAVYDLRTYFHSDILRSAINLTNGAATAVLDKPNGLALLDRIVQSQARNAGFADALACLVPVCAIALVSVWLLRSPREASHAVELSAE
jgi:MFS transporter, DHA2 family, multidrug resistance protein